MRKKFWRKKMDVPQISVNELSNVINEGSLLIDVRDPEEHTTARVPQAVSIPLSSVPDRLEEVPTDGPVYVICAKGGRSQMAAEFYAQQGVQAINVTGGTDAWLKAGHKHLSGPTGAER
jgi:rhodanese-related sulfurtransferase